MNKTALVFLLVITSTYGSKLNKKMSAEKTKLVNIAAYSIHYDNGSVSNNILASKDPDRFWNVLSRSHATLLNIITYINGKVGPNDASALIKIGKRKESYKWKPHHTRDPYAHPILLYDTGCEKIEIKVTTHYGASRRKFEVLEEIPFACGE